MDELLVFLNNNNFLAVAFAAWAYVVWHFGMKISNQVSAMSEKLRSVSYMVSNRLTKIEAHLEHNDPNFKPYRNGEN